VQYKYNDTVPTNYYDSQINRGYEGHENFTRANTVFQNVQELDF